MRDGSHRLKHYGEYMNSTWLKCNLQSTFNYIYQKNIQVHILMHYNTHLLKEIIKLSSTNTNSKQNHSVLLEKSKFKKCHRLGWCQAKDVDRIFQNVLNWLWSKNIYLERISKVLCLEFKGKDLDKKENKICNWSHCNR